MWPLRECWPREGRELGGIPRCLPSAWNHVGPSELLHRYLPYSLARLLREERTCGRNGCSSRRPVVRGPDSVPSRGGRSSSLYPTRLPGGAGTGPGSHTPVLAPHMHAGIHLRTRPPWPPHPPPTDVAVVSRPQKCRLETECPVFCGCRGRWGWGTGSPANKHTQRPLSSPAYAHMHTHGWAARWPQQPGCS